MTGFAGLMLAAWAMEIIFGWPAWLYKIIRHPVVWIGAGISFFEKRLNQTRIRHKVRYIYGLLSTLCVVTGAGIIGFGIAKILPQTPWGIAIEALIASSLLASRSLYTHVANVAAPLAAHDKETARSAVSQIVGRDTSVLDEAGMARAAIESLAENTSDGVTAPLFWGVIFGLPGLAAYKAINTLDSMIGHRTPRYLAFGGFAARLDDVVNFVPARLTGCSFTMASLSYRAFKIMLRDARKHRSPNAGWPESAMAGALNIRLSGPCVYQTGQTQDFWLNAEAVDPVAADIKRGLRIYVRAMILWVGFLTILIVHLNSWKNVL